jgi:DNA-directed RNA polymerase subunit K/omega
MTSKIINDKLITTTMADTSIQVFTYNNFKETYDPSKNISLPFLTIFEKTSVIGLRIQQIVLGAPTTLIEGEDLKFNNVEDIVMEELKQKKLPFIVCRKLPNGVKEYWHLKDLHIFD